MSDSREHPASARLALLAGGELEFMESLPVRFHLLRCDVCDRTYQGLRESRSRFRAMSADLPADLDWTTLEREMKANVRLGLAAGAVVDRRDEWTRWRPPVDEPLGWRAGVVMAAFGLVLVTGWWLNTMAPHDPPVVAVQMNGPVTATVDVNDSGVELKEAGGTLTLLKPVGMRGNAVADSAGGARARYLDGDTGQVTIYHVYADASQ